jgi:CubicO group peptidase (beta-lactamase class C family)
MFEILANLGADIGFLSVLHTWGQNLLAHPHLHCVIPAGGLSPDHTRWIFDRIGMKDTSYTPREWWAGRQAKPVEPDPRTKWSAADLLRTTVRDYATFMISVMNNEGVSQEIAAQRQNITRNLIAPEVESVLCEDAADPANCKVAMGFGLGWRIVKIDNETILDHTGADSDVKTFAFFIPKRKTGAIIFTNGPDVGHQMIDKVLGVLYPNRIYDATLWQ